MQNNQGLHKAKSQKCDEFYTQINDIEAELDHYPGQFIGKVVYCNCDDFDKSMFPLYFINNFKSLGLKRLITSGYGCEFYTSTELSWDKLITTRHILHGDGDFSSDACVNLLNQSDIVVTNPPFSLFRSFIDLLMVKNKAFLLVGCQTAYGSRDIWTYMVSNRIVAGYNGITSFVDLDGDVVKFGNIGWFTNLKTKPTGIISQLRYRYYPENYVKYDNYDAINVDKICNIPNDYFDVVGVPITYLNKHNPAEFEIVGFRKGNDGKDLRVGGLDKFYRILIRRIK